MDARIETLVVSPRHRYDGRPGDGPRPASGPETVERARLRAHKGIVGDRYFGTRHRFASVTFLAAESVERLETVLGGLLPGTGAFDPVLARRNVVTRGIDVEDLVHTVFTIDAGAGPMRFRSLTRANPCAWMNGAYADGAHGAMRGHAGIRCEPLDDGELVVGPVRLLDVVRLSPEELTAARRRATSTG